MLSLQFVDYLTLSKYFVDFQKHSHCFELPPDKAECVGAFKDNELVGYFILQAYDNKSVEINQGYLLPAYRHSSLAKEFMQMLETECKKAGHKTMLLGTHNRFRAYLKFAKRMGYSPMHLTFSKEI